MDIEQGHFVSPILFDSLVTGSMCSNVSIYNTQGYCKIANNQQGHFVSPNQSTDQPLMEVDGVPGGRSMYSSNSTLARSQYPTLPVGAVGGSGGGSWGAPYPSLARSTSHRSQGAQSDNVFLDVGVDGGENGPPASPGRYCMDPTFPNGFPEGGEVETDGGHSPFSNTLPRRQHKQPGECVCVCVCV